jgi:hypothetical protein
MRSRASTARWPVKAGQPRRGLTAEQEQAIWWLMAPKVARGDGGVMEG